MDAYDAPLADLVVLDLTRALAGPQAAMMLGDMGARVIKVESATGDDTRSWGPPWAGDPGPEDPHDSTYFMAANRNKESVVLDLKAPDDVIVLERLVAKADVLLENFRTGVLDRLGFPVAWLHELNPGLVVGSISGFGHDGPEAGRAGYDQIAQGEGGLMSLTGVSEPTKVGVPIADLLAGMFGAYGVLAALRERDRGGGGQVVRTSLLAGVVATHSYQGGRYLIGGEVPEPGGNRHPSIAPYRTYECSDGVIQVGVANEPIWRRFAALLELDADDPRFATNSARMEHSDALDPLIGARLASDTAAVWLERFREHGIPAGEVRSLDQVYASPQVRSQGLIVETEHPTLGSIRTPGPPLRFDRSDARDHTAPPTLGEHSEAIRAWLDE
jgi:crotonobetainyl-CoA:carnitine CoA-transferase CaiB-like acyl-CoA transferase